jgi:hypothetical protein
MDQEALNILKCVRAYAIGCWLALCAILGVLLARH